MKDPTLEQVIDPIKNGSSAISKFPRYNTTTMNILFGLPGLFSTFTDTELLRIRIIAIVSSCTSIAAGIVGFYYFIGIDKRRKVFRHYMIFFLIFCNFLKALILMIYPLVVLMNSSLYGKVVFYNVLGFFTAYAIEGADIAILIFAIHFAVSIFRPNCKWKNPRTGNMEGGLYYWRKFMYPFTALFPLLLASLAFIDFNKVDLTIYQERSTVIVDNADDDYQFHAGIGGYKPFSMWCYLPPYPYWYTLVLSWGPRGIIFLTICCIYVSIYISVIRQSKMINHELKELSSEQHNSTKYYSTSGNLVYIRDKIYRFIDSICHTYKKCSPISSIKLFCFLCSDISLEHDLNYEFKNNANKEIIDMEFQLGYTMDSNDLDLDDGFFNDEYSHGLHRFIREFKNVLKRENDQNFLDKTVLNSSFRHNDSHETSHNNYNLTCTLNESGKFNELNLNSKYDTKTKTSFKNDPLDSSPKNGLLSTNSCYISDLKQNFEMVTRSAFNKRRQQVIRQIKSIFLYPLSYLIVWTFPFIVYCTQFHYEPVHGPIVGLIYIASFMQSLSCAMNTLVFLYREKPWHYSWCNVETKELIRNYNLKGEIGERDIVRMCSSTLGKRGWFYRTKWLKKQCWKYSPYRCKRLLWYIYRFGKGVTRLCLDFSDNCFDDQYWGNYYLSGEDANKLIYRERKEETNQSANITVPMIWRIFHCFPMMGGIDLDEVDYYLRVKSRQDNFVIPGLEQVLCDSKRTIDFSQLNYKTSGLTDQQTVFSEENGHKPPHSAEHPSMQQNISNDTCSSSMDVIFKANVNNYDWHTTLFSNKGGLHEEISREYTDADYIDLLDFLKN